MTVLYIRSILGPYWVLPTFDPDYAYLMNALNFSQLTASGHADHPGTPLQMLGALIIWLHKPFVANTVPDVLRRPEHYIYVTACSLDVMIAIAMFGLGAVVRRVTGSVLWALLSQATPFLCARVLVHHSNRFSPEPVLIGVGVLVAALQVRYIQGISRSKIYAAAVGALCGLGVATKITFGPVLLGQLFVMSDLVTCAVFAGSAIAAFIVCTLPIIARYDHFFRWVLALLTHGGRYGTGASGFLDLSVMEGHWHVFWREASALLFALAVAAAVVAFSLAKRQPLSPEAARARRVLLGFIVAALMQVMIVMKTPEVHYLVPSLALTGTALAVALFLWRRVAPQSALSYLIPAAFGVVLIGLLISQVGIAGEILGTSRLRYTDASKIQSLLSSKYSQCAIVESYPTSSPTYALNFGSHWARSQYRPELARLHPGVFDIWSELESWTGPVTWRNLFMQKPCVVMRSIGQPVAPKRNIRVVAVFRGLESLFTLGLSSQDFGVEPSPQKRAEPVSVTPPSGAGRHRVFTCRVVDSAGASDVGDILFLIHSGIGAAGGCYILYDVHANVVDLATDQGSYWTAAKPLGSAAILENSQCRVNLANSSATPQGTELTLSVDVTFKASFAGSRVLYLYTGNRAGFTTGWHRMGTWSVP